MTIRIEIDLNRCTGCRMCVKSCTYGVLEWLDGEPVVVNPHRCAACLDCKRSCEAEAILIKVTGRV
jgi:NAD-dependent dihydropyrimidine dehydrogenase PreA subunit